MSKSKSRTPATAALIEPPHAGFIERLRFQFLASALRRGWNSERDGPVVGGMSEIQAIEAVAYAKQNGWLAAAGPSIYGRAKS